MRRSLAVWIVSVFTTSPVFASELPETWDIRGLRMGMSKADAEKQITQLLDPKQIKAQQSSFNAGGERLSFDRNISGASIPKSGNVTKETLGVGFPAPPNDPVVIIIGRNKKYDPPVSMDKMKEALIDKYGTPTSETGSSRSLSLVWTFDSNGAAITDNRKRCVMGGMGAISAHGMWSRGNFNNLSECSYGLSVLLSGVGDGTMYSLDMGMMNADMMRETGMITKKFIEDNNAKAQKAKMGQGAPEL